ncbi:MAG: hypothetical protein Q8N23_06495 [Archangium sp.]|nr:hypothetical protein [Archangium sp.]MDP3570698.1 hypothetical protein [Archangium sp.]
MIRRLNEAGLESFRNWLTLARADGTIAPPIAILTDDTCSELALPKATLSRTDFDRRLEFGEYLATQVSHSAAAEADVGFWSWIALHYIDQICPAESGSRKVYETERYILDRDYTGRYRHLCRTPWLLVHLHEKRARVALDGALHRHGEAAEQFLSRQQLFTNKALFQVLDRLYVTETRAGWRIKTGARSKTSGTMRRFGKIMRQFDLTWDLNGMHPDELFKLLPREFEVFTSHPAK